MKDKEVLQKLEDIRIDNYINEEASKLLLDEKYNNIVYIRMPYFQLYKIYDEETSKYINGLNLKELIYKRYKELKINER